MNLFDICKRLLDITIAIIAMVILSPIFLAIWISIRFGSKGPIIFRQERAGKHGKSFIFYKPGFTPSYVKMSELPEIVLTRHNTDPDHLIKTKQSIAAKPEMKTGIMAKQSTFTSERTVSEKTGQTLIPQTSDISNNESLKWLDTIEEDNLFSRKTASEKVDISGQNVQREPLVNQSLVQEHYEPSIVFTLEQAKSVINDDSALYALTNNDIGTNNDLSTRDMNNSTLHLFPSLLYNATNQ